MMHMEHRLTQTQTQRLMLTQKMQQAIHILQLSTQELEQYIQQEVETNPVIELATPESSADLLDQDANGHNDDSPDDREYYDIDTLIDLSGKGQSIVLDAANVSESGGDDGAAASTDTDGYAGQTQVSEPASYEGGGAGADASAGSEDFSDAWSRRIEEGQDFSFSDDVQERRDHFFNNASSEDTLASQLLIELHTAVNTDEEYAIGERIIAELDHRGYFTASLEEIAEEMNVPAERVESVLRVIQGFEPRGVAARNLTECLLVQIDAIYPNDSQLKELVRNHLQALSRHQIPKIAKAMGITPEQVEELKTKLARLDPWPGSAFAGGEETGARPDVIVEKNEDTGFFEVYLADDDGPRITIASEYQEMMARNGGAKGADRQFLREKMESAKWLIRNIEQRRQTILRIAKAIVEVQREFFDKGPEALKPLTLQEIADRVGVHEATVSRTTRGKFMQTPQGFFEMKYFFSPGLRSDNGEAQSSKSVQSLIKKIVDEEDKHKPLSDQKIAETLKKQGINIARRTVTKYREAQNIPPTNLRRSYD